MVSWRMIAPELVQHWKWHPFHILVVRWSLNQTDQAGAFGNWGQMPTKWRVCHMREWKEGSCNGVPGIIDTILSRCARCQKSAPQKPLLVTVGMCHGRCHMAKEASGRRLISVMETWVYWQKLGRLFVAHRILAVHGWSWIKPIESELTAIEARCQLEWPMSFGLIELH